jgi:hypothetical protein
MRVLALVSHQANHLACNLIAKRNENALFFPSARLTDANLWWS